MSLVENVKYHCIDPEQIKDAYGEFDVVDFMVNTDENIVAGSVRLEGVIKISQNGTDICDKDTRTHFNHRSGMHGVCESITTQLGGNGQVLEFLQSYGRIVNMKELSTKSVDDYFNSENITAYQSGTPEYSLQYACGKVLRNNAFSVENNDFSFKPFFCLNRIKNSSSLSLSPYGDVVKVSFNLARNSAFLTGSGVAVGSKYELSELRLSYRTVPSQPTPNAVASSYVSLKQTLQNNNVSINTRVPSVARAVSVSFLQQTKENNGVDNNYQCEKPPSPDELKFSFNDSTSGNFTSYFINDVGEMIQGGLESMGAGQKMLNMVQPQEYGGTNGFIIGANFNSLVDLRKTKFTMEFKSGINAGVPMLMFMYFHTEINFIPQ